MTNKTNIKKQLDAISPTMCVAKWKQVTIHLQNGQTHSCHHPSTHTIPLSEIRTNPTALHNTEFKKQQRKMMLEGIRPSECDYCWRVEDSGTELYSDRINKSAATWAQSYIQDIASKSWDDNVDPSCVEISFSNVCNFKCSYCAPQISSKWMEEIEQHGAYPTTTNFNGLSWLKRSDKMPIPNKEENPYVNAFWKWWPTMYHTLHRFRITGGEPLLAKDTFRVLDYVIANPNPNLELGINSNLCVPDELFDKFIEKLEIIVSGKFLKRVLVFTSSEAHGAQAEYIRYGMDYDKWLNNIDMLFKRVPEVFVTIMSTYNILSIPSYKLFLKDLLYIKQKCNRSHFGNLLLDIPYLRYPSHQTAFIATPELRLLIHEQIEFMKTHINTPDNPGFQEQEINGLVRLCDVLDSDKSNQTINRQDFVKFVDEHDRRRGTNFVNTFPELVSTYLEWKNNA